MNNLTLLEWCAEAYPEKTNIANAPALGENGNFILRLRNTAANTD